MKVKNLVYTGLILALPALSYASDISVGINLGGAGIFIHEAPPPPRVERHEHAPGPDFIWIQGHWNNHHGRWEWIRGHWDRRPGMRYIAGHWEQRGQGWMWIDDQWVTMAPPPPPPQAQVQVVVPQPPQPQYAPQPQAVIEQPQQPVVMVEQPVPALIVETPGRRPGHDFFWVGGHWSWQGVWVWIPGEWRRHPHFHEGAMWYPGHWEDRGHGHVWIEGYWR